MAIIISRKIDTGAARHDSIYQYRDDDDDDDDDNNNNNNIVICKAHKVSSNTESEAPAVARWAALVGYAKSRGVFRGGSNRRAPPVNSAKA